MTPESSQSGASCTRRGWAYLGHARKRPRPEVVLRGGAYGKPLTRQEIRMHIIAEQLLERPRLGLFEEMEREDDARGPEPEPDETASVFWRLVLPLAQKMPDDEDDACPGCGFWTCQCRQPS